MADSDDSHVHRPDADGRDAKRTHTDLPPALRWLYDRRVTVQMVVIVSVGTLISLILGVSFVNAIPPVPEEVALLVPIALHAAMWAFARVATRLVRWRRHHPAIRAFRWMWGAVLPICLIDAGSALVHGFGWLGVVFATLVPLWTVCPYIAYKDASKHAVRALRSTPKAPY